MNELLARAMQGVEPGTPGAFLTVFMNLMRLVPWGEMVLWQLLFIVVGVALGLWRGRLKATVIATLVLGPIGWVWPFLPRRTPPPLPRGSRPYGQVVPPPLPGSKKR